MTTLRLKKSGNAEEADPVVADSDSAAAAADAEKRMSMMRLKKPSMMRLRRLPKNRSVSMLRLKKAMTQLRLKRDPFEIDDAEEEEADADGDEREAGRGGEDVPACVWIKGVCVALDEVSGNVSMKNNIRKIYISSKSVVSWRTRSREILLLQIQDGAPRSLAFDVVTRRNGGS